MDLYGPSASMISNRAGASLQALERGPLSISGGPQGTGTDGFGSYLVGALDSVNSEQVNADNMVQDFLLGGDVPVHSVMSEMAKAETSLRLTVSVMQKAIDAYNEIARMQI